MSYVVLARGMTAGRLVVGEAPGRRTDPDRPFHASQSGAHLAVQAGMSLERLLVSARFVNLLHRWPGKQSARTTYRGTGSRFPMRKARQAASQIPLKGTVILVGRRVARAFGFASLEYFSPLELPAAVGEWPRTLVWVIPHPSRANRHWNRVENCHEARRYLSRIFA